MRCLHHQKYCEMKCYGNITPQVVLDDQMIPARSYPNWTAWSGETEQQFCNTYIFNMHTSSTWTLVCSCSRVTTVGTWRGI